MPQPELQGRVDIFDRGHPLGQAVVHFVAQGRIDPVHQKPRPVLDQDADLSDPGRQLPDGLNGPIGGLQPPDDLNELHDRHGAEEVHAREPVRTPGRRGELRDGDGGGVACKQHRGRAELLQLPEKVQLGLPVLDDRLDHEVAFPGRVKPGRRGDPSQGRRLVGGCQLAFGDCRGQILFDRGQPLPDELLRDIAEHHFISGRRHDLRDARAHEPGADHHDSLDFHMPSLFLTGSSRRRRSGCHQPRSGQPVFLRTRAIPWPPSASSANGPPGSPGMPSPGSPG